ALHDIPEDRVIADWRWELPRIAASRMGSERIADWIWERQELALDRACAARVRESAVSFFGVEFGSLAAIHAARRIRMPAVVAVLSPHHQTFTRYVETEYDKFPALNTRSGMQIAQSTSRRRARVDEEAATADWIVTGSSFTTKSLVDAGIPSRKIITVPLG